MDEIMETVSFLLVRLNDTTFLKYILGIECKTKKPEDYGLFRFKNLYFFQKLVHQYNLTELGVVTEAEYDELFSKRNNRTFRTHLLDKIQFDKVSNKLYQNIEFEFNINNTFTSEDTKVITRCKVEKLFDPSNKATAPLLTLESVNRTDYKL